jgi:hypothetical protein
MSLSELLLSGPRSCAYALSAEKLVSPRPTRPGGQRRRTEFIVSAVKIMRLVTAEEADDLVDAGKRPAAKAI